MRSKRATAASSPMMFRRTHLVDARKQVGAAGQKALDKIIQDPVAMR